jgi:multisubunit Na+/H+ antiporter MnhB subunit
MKVIIILASIGVLYYMYRERRAFKTQHHLQKIRIIGLSIMLLIVIFYQLWYLFFDSPPSLWSQP